MSTKTTPPTPPAPVAMNHGVRDPQRVNRAMTDLVSDLRAAGIYGRNTGVVDAAASRVEDQAIADLRRLQRDSQEPVGSFIRNNILPDSYAAPERPMLANLRDQQLAAPPREYVVRYYSWSNASQPRPQLVKETYSQGNDGSTLQYSHGGRDNGPLITRNNPMRPINADMHADVQHAFDTISSQLPGRFRFVQVNDPAQADIQVAAISNATDFSGIASRTNGSVLLDITEYSNRLQNSRNNPQHAAWERNQMQAAVLHEVLHAMGLTHPHGANEFGTRYGAANKPVNERATFFETVMTYTPNNNAGRGMGQWQVPVSLMPADISALQRMYPVAGDRRGAMVGTAAAADRRHDIGASIRSGTVVRDVLLPDSGVVLQPQPDGLGDSVQLRAAAGATVQLKQDTRGVMIGEPYLNTAAYLQFTPEQIRTSGGSDLVTLQNNASIYVERNRSHARDGIELRGSGNRISVPVGGEKSTQFTLHGDDYHFTLRNRGANIGRLPLINVNMGAGAQPVTSSWTRDDAGHYQLTMAGGRQTRTIRFELEEPSVHAIRQMDTLMDRQYARAPQRPIVPPSESAIEAARARVHGTKPSDFSDVEKQLLLEAAGYQTDGVTGRADGKVDGHYGATSRRAEASLRADLSAGRLQHLPNDVLNDIRLAFPVDKAPSMRASDGNVQRPTGGNPTPPDRSNKR